MGRNVADVATVVWGLQLLSSGASAAQRLDTGIIWVPGRMIDARGPTMLRCGLAWICNAQALASRKGP